MTAYNVPLMRLERSPTKPVLVPRIRRAMPSFTAFTAVPEIGPNIKDARRGGRSDKFSFSHGVAGNIGNSTNSSIAPNADNMAIFARNDADLYFMLFLFSFFFVSKFFVSFLFSMFFRL